MNEFETRARLFELNEMKYRRHMLLRKVKRLGLWLLVNVVAIAIVYLVGLASYERTGNYEAMIMFLLIGGAMIGWPSGLWLLILMDD